MPELRVPQVRPDALLIGGGTKARRMQMVGVLLDVLLEHNPMLVFDVVHHHLIAGQFARA